MSLKITKEFQLFWNSFGTLLNSFELFWNSFVIFNYIL